MWGAESGSQGALHTVDLPDFSFSPGEYITCVGEYLMTLPQVLTMYNMHRIRPAYLALHSKFYLNLNLNLPQHLEPYMTSNTPLSRAFRQAVFPGSSSLGSSQSPADFLLGCISASTCSSYLSYISSIPRLTPTSCRQLAVDISYLGDILDDLGHPLSPELSSAGALLRLPAESLASESSGHPGRVVAIVTRLRGMGAE